MNGISDLQEGTLETFLSLFLPREDTMRSLQLGRGPSSEPDHSSPHLRLLASRTVRNRFMFSVSYPVCGTFL